MAWHLARAALLVSVLSAVADEFTERLDFQPLSHGYLLSHFQFSQTRASQPTNPSLPIDYGTFPPAIDEIVREYGLEEFRLSFGRGRWAHEAWGRAPFQLASTGIQLHAWFRTEHVLTVDERWVKLTHALSGLLCCSLGLLNEAKTSIPSLSDFGQFSRSPGSELRFGVLPREAICTENLTPWVKMLPCMSNAGIASLLNPIKIYDSEYNLMDLWVTVKQGERSSLEITMNQNLAVVFDLIRWNQEADWNLSLLFDRQIEALCPLSAEKAEISHYYDESQTTMLEKWTEMERVPPLTPEQEADDPPFKGIVRYRGSKTLCYREIGLEMKELGIEKAKPVPEGRLPLSELTMARMILGKGQEHGTVFCRIENHSKTRTIPFSVLEVLPWCMRIYLHTLRVFVNGKPQELDRLLYSPAIDRVQPSQLEWQISLEPSGVVTVEYEFDMTLLRYAEYPLDPARGFDVKYRSIF